MTERLFIKIHPELKRLIRYHPYYEFHGKLVEFFDNHYTISAGKNFKNYPTWKERKNLSKDISEKCQDLFVEI